MKIRTLLLIFSMIFSGFIFSQTKEDAEKITKNYDLEKIKGDFTQNYQTIPVKYGEKFTKILITILSGLTLNPIYFLLKFPEIGGMKYYFYLSIITLLFFVILLWMSTSKRNYVALHLIIKFLIVTGVASLSLIDYSIIIEKLLLK